MGWRGTLRAINAANRRSARAADQRRRQIEMHRRAQEKYHARLSADMEAEDHTLLVEQLRTMHCDCGPTWDWQALAREAQPLPLPVQQEEAAMLHRAMNYEPSRLDKLMRRSEKIRAQLFDEAKAARERDEQRAAASASHHAGRVQEWQERKALAEAILGGDPEAMVEVVEENNPFDEIAFLGSTIELRKKEGKSFELDLHTRGSNVIPTEIKTVTQAGKLSVRKMPVGQYQELYQDYVCGCAFRVAREMFALLSLDDVYVTAYADMLNPATGHIEETPVLSAQFMRATFERLSFDRLDPSDALVNVRHVMDFRKTKGFAPIIPLVP